MISLSAVIITRNEERNIERCLQALRDIATEIVVVDSGSTDNTEAICQNHPTRFIRHDWEGFSMQKNFAETLATGDWVLSLDADEAIDDTLRASLLQLLSEGPHEGEVYSMNRLTNFCGHWIRHCGWYPDTKVRLWQRGTARWEGDVHEQLVFSKPVKTVRLKGNLLHYSYYTLDELTTRQAHYYQLAAQEAYAKGKRCGQTALWLRPLWRFVRDYLFRGGFLDGEAGYTVCRMNAHYTFMKYATLRELNNASPSPHQSHNSH